MDGSKKRRRFWKIRLVIILAQAPIILCMQILEPNWLLPYLVWMSFFTWVSAELPSG